MRERALPLNGDRSTLPSLMNISCRTEKNVFTSVDGVDRPRRCRLVSGATLEFDETLEREIDALLISETEREREREREKPRRELVKVTVSRVRARCRSGYAGETR